MKNPILKLTMATLVAAGFFAATLPIQAQDQKAKTEAKAEAKSKSHVMPFRAKIVSVDKGAQTVVLGKRTFQVTPQTKIMKEGDKPATLADAKEGVISSGSYTEAADKLLLVKFHIGPKPEKEAEKK